MHRIVTAQLTLSIEDRANLIFELSFNMDVGGMFAWVA
jgi:hypothetical protein